MACWRPKRSGVPCQNTSKYPKQRTCSISGRSASKGLLRASSSSRTCAASTGFRRYPLAWRRKACMAYSSKPVTKMIRLFGETVFSRTASSSPLRPGIRMSVKITSGRTPSSSMARRAAFPSGKARSSAPGSARAIASRSVSSKTGSSSIANISISNHLLHRSAGS